VQTAEVAYDARQEKADLRDVVLAARRQLGADSMISASAGLAAAAIGEWGGADCVAAYLSFGEEPPTREMVEGFVARGTRVLIPVIAGDRLDWATYSGADDVADGPLGIIEPTGSRLGSAALQAAEVVIVPALAVDGHGHRLGRGRGYYDRVLGSVTVPTAAVVYDDEVLQRIPVETHDRTVTTILQPSGITWVE
jgi:5-formyltetrahydrofolate cyclo-ligase